MKLFQLLKKDIKKLQNKNNLKDINIKKLFYFI